MKRADNFQKTLGSKFEVVGNSGALMSLSLAALDAKDIKTIERPKKVKLHVGMYFPLVVGANQEVIGNKESMLFKVLGFDNSVIIEAERNIRKNTSLVASKTLKLT